MVSLQTVRRVLAVDCGLGADEIERWGREGMVGDPVESTLIPIADALGIIALAELESAGGAGGA